MLKTKPVVYKNIGPFSEERIKLSETLFETITPVMNHIHEVGYSRRFWMLVVEEYIRSILKTKHLLDKERCSSKPGTFCMETAFTLPTLKDTVRQWVSKFLRHLKNRKDLKLIEQRLKKAKHVYCGFPVKPNFDPQFESYELPCYHSLVVGKSDRSRRGRAASLVETKEDIYHQNIIRLLPKIWVEYFQAFYERIPLHAPEEKTFHVHTLTSPFDHLLVAKYIEHGSKLIWYQHGALYGEVKIKYRYWFEQKVADEFRTWGWQMNEKDVPDRAFRLEKFRRKLNGHHSEREYDLMLCYPNVHKGNREDFSKKTDLLLSKCDPERYQKILARPRPVNGRRDQSGILGFIKDDRVMISNGLSSIAQEISKSYLVLQMEVPSTNFMECIYVDHPVMGVLSNDQPTDIIKPYYDFFLKMGVMHKDWKSLALHLSVVDVKSWWADVTSQPEYRSYKKTFTREV